MNAVLLMMGGSGSRFGADRPKQYTELDGRPLFSYIVGMLDGADCIDRLVVVSHSDWLDYAAEWCGKAAVRLPFEVVAGGSTRSESVRNGLRALAAHAKADDVVMMHDATHPYFDAAATEQLIEAVKEYGGATLASRNYDTVYRMKEDGFLECVEPRELIVAGASPEAFRFGDIHRIYEEASDEEFERMTSAGAIALHYNIPMKVIPTDILNLKITYPEDMRLLKLLYSNYFFSESDRREGR